MSGDAFSMPASRGGFVQDQNNANPNPKANPNPVKKKRNLPGTPDPDAEVIALSPKTLMATNRFICEICNKGFQRDQNLQLHRRGHNLPWKLRQRTNKEVRKKVYICPEKTCVHHDPSRALGDLTGIKKHYSRKHGEKKWKCEKCSKKYAVQSDWKAHSKTCGTREYKCDCGTLFSRDKGDGGVGNVLDSSGRMVPLTARGVVGITRNTPPKESNCVMLPSLLSTGTECER
ncbi:zinc finger protein [Theobroma cacao]|nr:zinc finger protein [Theobroma cacao]